jgi:hypothetical protein
LEALLVTDELFALATAATKAQVRNEIIVGYHFLLPLPGLQTCLEGLRFVPPLTGISISASRRMEYTPTRLQ